MVNPDALCDELLAIRNELEPFKDVAHRFAKGWLGEEEACEQLVSLLKSSPGPYAVEIARLQDVVLALHAERHEYVVKLDAAREAECTPAERAVLDAMWAIPDGTLSLSIRPVSAENWVSLPDSIRTALSAELERRQTKS